MRLREITRQDWVVLPGHSPFCGGGASSLFSEFGAIPVRLATNADCVMTSRPPALVPEYPSD
jgi:hypothetical protein